ncbi:MAG TPA: FAD/NAD(P)-binding protein [Pseudorhizobium sp.]|nr:FAD/NAD(P)-binding protein [Pseudorhizobium sp.]
MIPRIAVIGCGPTGLYTLKSLVVSKLPLSITVFEAEAEPGKGTPYHPDITIRPCSPTSRASSFRR